MHLPPGSSVQMINHDRVTTDVLVNWLPHYTYFQVTSPCMLKSDKATSHQVHPTAGTEECHAITLFCLLSQLYMSCNPWMYLWTISILLG